MGREWGWNGVCEGVECVWGVLEWGGSGVCEWGGGSGVCLLSKTVERESVEGVECVV